MCFSCNGLKRPPFGWKSWSRFTKREAVPHSNHLAVSFFEGAAFLVCIKKTKFGLPPFLGASRFPLPPPPPSKKTRTPLSGARLQRLGFSAGGGAEGRGALRRLRAPGPRLRPRRGRGAAAPAHGPGLWGGGAGGAGRAWGRAVSCLGGSVWGEVFLCFRATRRQMNSTQYYLGSFAGIVFWGSVWGRVIRAKIVTAESFGEARGGPGRL